MGVPSMQLLAAKTSGAAAFEPTDIAGCIAWWDASDTATITSSGGAVSQWNDKSTAARHATQSTAGLKPTTGAATQNGLNVITFDADRLNFTGITTDDVARTYFIVAKKDAVAAKRAVICSTGDNSIYLLFNDSATSGTFEARRNTSVATPASALATATYGIIRYTDTGGTTNAIKCGLNGTFGTAATGGATTPGTFDVIGAYPAAGSLDLQGAIAEIVVYDTVLDSTDLATVESYLNDKWAVY